MKYFIYLAIWTSGWLCGIIWTDGQQLQIDKLKMETSRLWHRDDEKEKAAIERETDTNYRLDVIMGYERLRQIKNRI